MSIRGNGMPKLSKFQWKYLSYMVPLTHWKHNSRCVKTNLRFTFRGLRILELHTKSGIVDFTRPSPKWGLWKCVTPLYLWSFDLSRSSSWIFWACWMFLVVVVVVVEGPVVPHQQNSIDLIDPHSKIAKIDSPSFEADLVYKPPFSRLMQLHSQWFLASPFEGVQRSWRYPQFSSIWMSDFPKPSSLAVPPFMETSISWPIPPSPVLPGGCH